MDGDGAVFVYLDRVPSARCSENVIPCRAERIIQHREHTSVVVDSQNCRVPRHLPIIGGALPRQRVRPYISFRGSHADQMTWQPRMAGRYGVRLLRGRVGDDVDAAILLIAL